MRQALALRWFLPLADSQKPVERICRLPSLLVPPSAQACHRASLSQLEALPLGAPANDAAKEPR